ncbi:MAG: TIGR03960 family B12-binding radical SAM protein [Candidatus Coatesbacteria bacterium]|nr:MAG: TIGR03960 family B12-binding radical SAM protein [Candidatus Coatesbacteria bacterium]
MPGLYDNLLKVQRPSRYTDREVGSIIKREANLRVCLIYPDLYEIATSNLGIQIIYQLLNNLDGVSCERAFLPAPDAIKLIIDSNDTLRSLETRTPLSKFDVLAFSVSYELQYTNILAILDLAKIPFRSEERDGSPLVIMGGYATYSPSPISPVFDIITIGEGEEVARELFTTLRDAKINCLRRDEILSAVKEIEGIYIPQLFEVGERIKTRVVKDLDHMYVPENLIVPSFSSVHDRLSVEIARGCRRGCRFCISGFVQRPYRERSPLRVVEIVNEQLRRTGYDEISLMGLNTIDYTMIAELTKYLTESLREKKIGVSLPSLRIDTPLIDTILNTQMVRPSQITLAPEVGVECLSSAINKEYDRESFIEKIVKLNECGISSIKLYFMIGLPGETDDDAQSIIDLVREIRNRSRSRRLEITVHISAFVPKPHTPLQWSPFADVDTLKSRIKQIRSGLRGRAFKVKYQNVEMSLLEAILGRGDARLFKVIERAYRNGAILDGWYEHFRWDMWRDAIEYCGLFIDDLSGEIPLNYTLPWEFIDTGVSKDYLLSENRSYREKTTTPQCDVNCRRCDACDEFGIRLAGDEHLPETKQEVRRGKRIRLKTPRLRFIFSKTDDARYLSHLDTQRAFHLALRRAEIPVAFTEGYNPLPRLTLGHALALGIEGLCEVGEVRLSEPINAIEFMESMDAELPYGINITSARNLGVGAPEPAEFDILEYSISTPESDSKTLEELAKKTLGGEIARVKRGDKVKLINLQRQIHRWWVDNSTIIVQVRIPDEGATIRINELVNIIFNGELITLSDLKVVRNGVFILLGDRVLSPMDEKTFGY